MKRALRLSRRQKKKPKLAEQLVKDAGENGKTSAAEEMERARIAGEAVLAEAEKEAAKDVEALKAVTEGKVSDAIAAVINDLI